MLKYIIIVACYIYCLVLAIKLFPIMILIYVSITLIFYMFLYLFKCLYMSAVFLMNFCSFLWQIYSVPSSVPSTYFIIINKFN